MKPEKFTSSHFYTISTGGRGVGRDLGYTLMNAETQLTEEDIIKTEDVAKGKHYLPCTFFAGAGLEVGDTVKIDYNWSQKDTENDMIINAIISGNNQYLVVGFSYIDYDAKTHYAPYLVPFRRDEQDYTIIDIQNATQDPGYKIKTFKSASTCVGGYLISNGTLAANLNVELVNEATSKRLFRDHQLNLEPNQVLDYKTRHIAYEEALGDSKSIEWTIDLILANPGNVNPYSIVLIGDKPDRYPSNYDMFVCSHRLDTAIDGLDAAKEAGLNKLFESGGHKLVSCSFYKPAEEVEEPYTNKKVNLYVKQGEEEVSNDDKKLGTAQFSSDGGRTYMTFDDPNYVINAGDEIYFTHEASGKESTTAVGIFALTYTVDEV